MNREEPKPTTAITLEDIDKFRVGLYDDATEDTKDKWCHVMLHFLPSVCARYSKDEQQMTQRVSEVATASDEALVMWLVRFNAEVWETEKNEAENDSSQEDNGTKKKRKRTGPHMSQLNLQVFLDMLNGTIARRKENDGGKGWDNALILAAKTEHQNASGANGNAVFDDDIVGTGKAVVAIQPIVMHYDWMD